MKRADRIILGSLLIICFFDLIIAYQVIGLNHRYLHAENGFLENIQVALLILSCFVFLSHLFFSGKYHQIFSMGGAFLCFVFCLRELDIEKLDLPTIFILAGSGMGRNLSMAILGGTLLIYFIVHFQKIKGSLPAFLFEKSSLTILTGLLLLVLGIGFDKKSFIVDYSQFYEEILEVTGYFFILIGAVLSCPVLQKINDSDLNVTEFN